MPGASGYSGIKRRASEPVHQSITPPTSAGSSCNNSANTSGISLNAIRTSSTSGSERSLSMALVPTNNGTTVLSEAKVMKMKADAFEKDRDNFLNCFEKPTQIYRFLRARMAESPIFLHRNLSYMNSRMSRSHKSRIGFKVDSLLKEIDGKMERDHKFNVRYTSQRRGMLSGPTNYYNFILMGFTDGQLWQPDTKARVDVCLARVCMKKRKDGAGPVSKIFEKCVDVKIHSPISPTSSQEISIPRLRKCPVVSIPADLCNVGTNGHTVRSYKLVVRVSLPSSCLENPNSSQNMGEQTYLNSRNHNNNYNENLEGPKSKRRRSAPATKDRENFIYDGDAMRNQSSGSREVDDYAVVYTGNISLYEKDISGDSIKEVDFDLHLRKAVKGTHKMNCQRIRKEISWENFDEKHAKIMEQAKPAGKSAKLCVAVRSSTDNLPCFVEPPSPLSDGALNDSMSTLAQLERKKSVRVIYQFMYGNNSQQQTESRDDLRCPWCSINCMALYSLLKHLKLCHPRYQFSYTPIPNGAKIDVIVNDSYDGSYSGSAFDLVSQPPGEAFARNGPTKRTEVFSILVCRPKPVKQSLQEFFDCDEKDGEQRRTYITGHNRLYHHTSTCLPIHPREIDVDSEGEPDPEWLRVKTTMMIDEFTDVNEGEKELMKLWNLHVMKHNYVGDCQIPLSCKRFVELHGKELIEKNLYRNFCLHLTNLFDFGLLTPQGVHSSIQLLHSQMKDTNTAPSLREAWKISQINIQNAKNGINGLDAFSSSPVKSLISNTASSSMSTTPINPKTVVLNSITASSCSSLANNIASGAINGTKTLELKITKISSTKIK